MTLVTSNWRPKTLLNTDCKISAKVIANRLKKNLDKLISKDQTGFMQGRNISSNIQKIMDLSSYCEKENVDAIVLVADFENCFDSIELRSVDKILHYFGFGPNIRSMVQLLFQDIQLSVLSNGYTTDWFDLERGLLQGNPVASYLYLYTGQLLNDRLMANHSIKGININGQEIKSIQFADDLNLPLLFDQQSLSQAIAELQMFQQQVGLKINLNKSLIYRIGALKNSTCILNSQGIEWTNLQVKILGINVVDDQKLEQANIEPLIDKMRIVCDT